MVIKNVNLETVCGITSKLPENTLPEVAFAGKSNVGKSSLINALMNRKSYSWNYRDKDLLYFFRNMGKVRNEQDFLKTADVRIIQINEK